MTEPWYRLAFGPLYEEIYSHRNRADARRAVRCIRDRAQVPPDAAPILDLCCGAGRHATEWVDATNGPPPVGLDLSEHLLGRARREAPDLPLVRADMRHLPFASGRFAAVFNLFTSFGYFREEEENAQVFREVARTMRPGGRFVFDHINPAQLRAELRPETRRTTPSGLEIHETRRIDETARRVEKTIAFQLDGQRRRIVESVRIYEPDEVRAMARAAHMRLAGHFGDFDGAPAGPGAPRAIYVFVREAD